PRCVGGTGRLVFPGLSSLFQSAVRRRAGVGCLARPGPDRTGPSSAVVVIVLGNAWRRLSGPGYLAVASGLHRGVGATAAAPRSLVQRLASPRARGADPLARAARRGTGANAGAAAHSAVAGRHDHRRP